MVSQQRLKELLKYDPYSGSFTRRVTTSNKTKKGSIAGCKNVKGYIQIMIDGKNYLGHRLAWLYMKGIMPKLIDHRDEDKSNNSFSNLREASLSTNQINISDAQRNNLSGFRGVSKLRSGRFSAKFRGAYLGSFDTAIEASKAYEEAKCKLK